MRLILDATLARRVIGENARPGRYSRPTTPRSEGSKELREALASALDAALPPHSPPANGRPVDLHVAGNLLAGVERARQAGWGHLPIGDYVSGLFAALNDPEAARAAAPKRLEDARIAEKARAEQAAQIMAQNEVSRAERQVAAELAKVRRLEQERQREEERLRRQVSITGNLTAAQGVVSGSTRRKLAVGFGASVIWYELYAEREVAIQLDSFLTGEVVSIQGDPQGSKVVLVTSVAPADPIRHRLRGSKGPGIDVQTGAKPGFTHVDVPRASLTAKRIGVPFARAIVGWNSFRGRFVPEFSGIVVATADAERLMAAIDKRISKKLQISATGA